MSKTYRPPYRIYRTLFLLLVLAAIALNGICFYLSYEYAEERDGADGMFCSCSQLLLTFLIFRAPICRHAAAAQTPKS